MNRFILQGRIHKIKYLEDCVVVYVDDKEPAYQTSSGSRVEEIYYTWKVQFKANPFKSFITKYFNEGSLVEIDAHMRPYSTRNNESVDGYTCFGISINRGSYVNPAHRSEQRLMKESQETSTEKPNLEEYLKPDF